MTPDFIVPEKAVLQRSGMGELYVIDADTGDKHIAASRRADGSLRKSIKVRPGFMPLDEQRRYKAGGSQAVVDKNSSPFKSQTDHTTLIPGLVITPNSSTLKSLVPNDCKNQPTFSVLSEVGKACTYHIENKDKNPLTKKRREKKKATPKLTIQYVIEEPTSTHGATDGSPPSQSPLGHSSPDDVLGDGDNTSVQGNFTDIQLSGEGGTNVHLGKTNKYDNVTDKGELETAMQRLRKKITESKRLRKQKEDSKRELLPAQEEKLNKLPTFESELSEVQRRIALLNLGTQ